MGASGSVRERNARSAVVERLKRRSDFRAAAAGARAASRAFVVQARARGDEGAVRVGFTVSRQVGNAVERNRVRRRLREMVRVSGATDSARMRPGHDYVLIGQRAALAAPFAEMMRDLDAALSRIHAQGRASGGRGTGGTGGKLLNEAGSSSRPFEPRRSRKPSKRSPKSHPPQER